MGAEVIELPPLAMCGVCGRLRRRDMLREMRSADALACIESKECHRLVAGGDRAKQK